MIVVEPIMCDHISFLRYPIDDSVGLFGKKWTGPVLMEILSGANRFNTLLRTIPGISARTLSMRLDELETFGIVRRITSESGRVEYAITEKGQDMRTVLREVASFSLKWHNAYSTMER